MSVFRTKYENVTVRYECNVCGDETEYSLELPEHLLFCNSPTGRPNCNGQLVEIKRWKKGEMSHV